MNSTIQIRIDKKTKELAKKKFKSIGLDISSGIKLYLSEVIKPQNNFTLKLTENGYTGEFEDKMIKETNWAIKHGKSFSSAKELHEYILKN